MLAPSAGSWESRVVASARCAATAIADKRVSHAYCARARVTCRALLPQRPPTSIAKTMSSGGPGELRVATTFAVVGIVCCTAWGGWGSPARVMGLMQVVSARWPEVGQAARWSPTGSRSATMAAAWNEGYKGIGRRMLGGK